MNCPHCCAVATTLLAHKTSLGYRTFRCTQCFRKFNERAGTPYNHLQFPTDIVLLVVLWRVRYKLSLRDLAEIFLERGLEFNKEALCHQCSQGLGRALRSLDYPAVTLQAQGQRWQIMVLRRNLPQSRWQMVLLYRAIDKDSNLVDSMLSEHRDMEAAKCFFTQAKNVVGHAPEKVTTDGHDSYPRAIRRILGRKVKYRTSRYLNNRLEQDHRGVKQRYYPMRGLGSFEAASRFCRAFDEQLQYFRYRTKPKETIPLAEQRHRFRQRFAALQYLMIAA